MEHGLFNRASKSSVHPERTRHCLTGTWKQTIVGVYNIESRKHLPDIPKKEGNLATLDRCCSIHPYFKIREGHVEDFKALCERFVAKTNQEPKALYYGFSLDGNEVHCREGYSDAEGLLSHLDNVASLLEEALKIADLTRLEVHGAEEELSKLRESLASLKPQFFTLEYGFRR